MRAWCFIAVFMLGCESGEKDYCEGVALPECPPECPEDYWSTCGEPCETEGEACGNTIGDGRECFEGLWRCSEHAPLEPDACNAVCR